MGDQRREVWRALRAWLTFERVLREGREVWLDPVLLGGGIVELSTERCIVIVKFVLTYSLRAILRMKRVLSDV